MNWLKNVLRTLKGEPRVYYTLAELNPDRDYTDCAGDLVRYNYGRGTWEYRGIGNWYKSYDQDHPFTEVR